MRSRRRAGVSEAREHEKARNAAEKDGLIGIKVDSDAVFYRLSFLQSRFGADAESDETMARMLVDVAVGQLDGVEMPSEDTWAAEVEAVAMAAFQHLQSADIQIGI